MAHQFEPVRRRTLLLSLASLAGVGLLAACGVDRGATAPPAGIRSAATPTNAPTPAAASDSATSPSTSPGRGVAVGTPTSTQAYQAPITAGATVRIVFDSYNLGTAGPTRDATEQLLGEFATAHPAIQVDARATPSNELISKVQAQVVAGDPPDLIQGIYGDLDFIVNDLRAQAIEDLVPPDELSAWQGGQYPMSPKALLLSTIGGKAYGVPFTLSTPTLFSNADLVTAAGLDPSRPPATWDEVKQHAVQIKQRTGKEGIVIDSLRTYAWIFQALVRSNGGRVLSEDRKTATFAEPAAADAVKMWQELVQSGAHPRLSGNDAQSSFASGDLGMLLISSAHQGRFLGDAKGKWTLRSAKLPAFGSKPAVPTNSGSGLFILARDPLKQRAAWELMKFATSERSYTIITSKMGYLPLRTGIVNDERYLKSWAQADPLVQPNLEQLDVIEPWVAWPGPSYRQAEETMLKALEQVVYYGAPAESTLKQAQERVQGMLPRQ